ncbi:MAG: molybdopterin-dependent oxidoreductase, partial [Actinomycetota bacterium]|nr:molybdopterin-dependent oxidoreductase [Actinomycetota bacterium]
RPYRFRARPWDLEQVESTCTSCAFGCKVAVQSSSNRLTRYIGIDSDPVNQSWLCDMGRFDYEAVNSADRLGTPLVRRHLLDEPGEGDELVETSWGKALDVAARGLSQALSVHGAGAVAVLGGARLPNEDAYAWAKLAKGVLGTDNVDCQLDDGLPADAVLGLPRATVDDACRADAVILLGPDVKEELPVLYLRLKAAAVDDDMPIVELAPQRSGMSRYCRSTLLYRPGEAAVLAQALTAAEDPRNEVAGVPAEEIVAARRILGSPLEGQIVAVLGRPSVAERGESIAAAAAALVARFPGIRFLPALRRANVMGALDMGLAPGVLPGRVGLDEGRAWFAERWPGLPERHGLDAGEIMAAAARGQVQGLVLLGADPVTDYPDRQLARQALAGAGFVVAVDNFLTASSVQADVVLPAAAYAERSGTTTNIEGRITRLGQKIVPPGVAWPDWIIAVELAARLGADLGVDSLDAIWDEIERVAPSHAGVSRALLADRRFRDGVIPPVGGGQPSDLGPSGEARTDATAASTTTVPGAIDPMSTPGIGAVEVQGVPATEVVGNGRTPTTGAVPGDPGGEGPAADGAARRPALLRFSVPGDVPVPPSRDAYSLRLVAARKLYGHGTLVQESPSLAPLGARPILRVHPSELERLGMSEGGRVRVRGARATFLVDACPDPGVPWGSVSLAFNAASQPAGRDGSAPGQRLPAAGELIDSATPVTDVRIETP